LKAETDLDLYMKRTHIFIQR